MSTLKAINLQHPSATNPAIVLATDGSAAGNFSSSNGGPLAGFRNRIINGNFDIWQRGTSSASVGYNTADRWANSFVGSSCTLSRQAFALGQTNVPGEPTYFSRSVVVTSAGASNFSVLQQFVEDVRTFAGQQVTISFWAKADASKPIAIELLQNFGTGGSPSAEVQAIGVTKTTLSTSWQKITVTASLPSISGKTLGSNVNHYLGLSIFFDAGTSLNARTDSLGQQSGTFDIAQVQVEPGPVATPFEQRPIGTELSLCQRYYQEHQYQIGGVTTSGVGMYGQIFYTVRLRGTPTTVFSSVGAVGNFDTAVPAVASVNNVREISFSKTATGTGAGIYSFLGTFSAEL